MYALDFINKDRADHNRPQVVLGNNPAAQLHAEDMLEHDYLGHWWVDGRKPYMVYTETGGRSYAAENADAVDLTEKRWQEKNCNSPLVNCTVEAIQEMQWSMVYADADADWVHSKNILSETHRAVNIGIASNGKRVTFVQHFEGGDVEADGPPMLTADGKLTLSLSKHYDDVNIARVVSIFYDPTPTPKTPAEIEKLKSYCIGGGFSATCGDPVARVLKPPPSGSFYSTIPYNEIIADEWTEIERSFRFSALLGGLVDKPGVYIVQVMRDSDSGWFSEVLLELSVAKPIPGLTVGPTPTPTAAPAPVPSPIPTSTPAPAPTPFPLEELRQYALDLINKDRADHDLPPVVLGDNPAAQLHAEDMLAHDYLGHWWIDGRKPYMVYTETGGKSYAAENAASSGWSEERWQEQNCGSLFVRCSVPSAREAVTDLQWSMMYDDASSNWGHRDNILDEGHRAVNIGIASNNKRVTFVQHFEGGEVEATRRPILTPIGTLSLSLSKPHGDVNIRRVVSIYYDPPPTPKTPAEIDALDSYCIGGGFSTECGDPIARIIKPAPPGSQYHGLLDNDVIANKWTDTGRSFSFSASMGDLVDRPGVYTVIVWRHNDSHWLSEALLELSVVKPG